MDGLAAFGMFGFIFSMIAMSRVTRLERILRENGIRPAGAGDLGNRLRDMAGRTVAITLYEGEGSTTTPCRVLDVDEEWALVVRNEGKKNRRELLIRLCDIKQIKA